MNKSKFIEQLRITANELTPMTQSAAAGASTWNGTEYAKVTEAKSPNPYALSWQAMLGAIADLLEAQESPLSEKQVRYLNRLLFGGMGSLNDLTFNPKLEGDVAMKVNETLDRQRRTLFARFNDK